jgi:hypothetical protein
MGNPPNAACQHTFPSVLRKDGLARRIENTQSGSRGKCEVFSIPTSPVQTSRLRMMASPERAVPRSHVIIVIIK